MKYRNVGKCSPSFLHCSCKAFVKRQEDETKTIDFGLLQFDENRACINKASILQSCGLRQAMR